jgi:hypothetical protein
MFLYFVSACRALSSFETTGPQRDTDVQGKIRCLAAGAIQKARAKGLPLIEVEFPPLLGGRNAKRQTDDYSNIEVVVCFSTFCSDVSGRGCGGSPLFFLANCKHTLYPSTLSN